MKPDACSPHADTPLWWLRWVPAALATLLIIYFLYVIGSVAIVPVLASFGLAYLLNPIAQTAQNRGLSRPWASLFAIGFVSLILAGILSFVLPNLWVETTRAASQISEKFTPENAAYQRGLLRRYSVPLDRMAGDRIEKFLSDPGNTLGELLATEDEEQSNWTLSTLIASLDLVLVPFFVFYILVDFQRWRTSAEALIPPRFRKPFSRLFDESGRILQSYVRGQLLIGMIMACCYAVGFGLLGVPAWPGISLLAGLLNIIPYFGTGLGIVLACVFTLANGGSWWSVAAVCATFAIVQTFEGYVLTPRILGGRLNLHPMAVLMGLLIGGKLFGLMGIILAIPGIAIAKVFFKFFRELYEGSSFYTRGSDDFAPSDEPPIETRISDAASKVLVEQEQREDGVLG